VSVLGAMLAGVLVAVALTDLAAAAAAGRSTGRRRLPGQASGTVEGAAGARPGRAARPRIVAALTALGRRLGAPAPPGDLRVRIEAAGSPGGVGVGDVMALKAAAALVALLGGAPLAAALPGRLPIAAALALPVAGFLAPDAVLARRARRRARVMQRELPDLLDSLRFAVAAGLSLDRALAEVARRHRGALAREWGRAAGELSVGVPRARALEGLACRCPAPGMAALVAALERADRHGAPLAGTLAAQSLDARAARAAEIREAAARAAPKIQLVIALGLVPSVLLLVAAAMLDSLTGVA
jgi:tight adherence protein C